MKIRLSKNNRNIEFDPESDNDLIDLGKLCKIPHRLDSLNKKLTLFSISKEDLLFYLLNSEANK